MPRENAIEAEELTRHFAGGVRALDGVSLTVEEGEIFGLPGHHGVVGVGAGQNETAMIPQDPREPRGVEQRSGATPPCLRLDDEILIRHGARDLRTPPILLRERGIGRPGWR